MIDPEAITSIVTAIGALGSTSIGFYFNGLRRRRRDEEPARVEEAAVEAVSDVIADPPPSVTQKPGRSITATEPQIDEITKAVVAAVGTVFDKTRKKSDRAAFVTALSFFLAGILATIAITLYVHPGS